jgi:single-stranded DNA-binding protein
MATVKFTQSGIVEEISAIITKTTSASSFRMQTLIIVVPAWTDQFGEKKDKDQFWEFTIYNAAADGEALLSRFQKGDRVTVEAYLNSREFRFKPNGPYTYETRIASVKTYEPKQKQ